MRRAWKFWRASAPLRVPHPGSYSSNTVFSTSVRTLNTYVIAIIPSLFPILFSQTLARGMARITPITTCMFVSRVFKIYGSWTYWTFTDDGFLWCAREDSQTIRCTWGCSGLETRVCEADTASNVHIHTCLVIQSAGRADFTTCVSTVTIWKMTLLDAYLNFCPGMLFNDTEIECTPPSVIP